jgi:hypothetical protein
LKRIYLIGGLGNNLFQIQKGLESAEEICFVTNLIKSQFFSRLIGWTFHSPEVLNLNFESSLRFKQISWFICALDLFAFLLAKRFKSSLFGVSWEAQVLTRCNFGYFQKIEKSLPTVKINWEYHENEDHNVPLVHVRLGDSPTLEDDLFRQLRLISVLDYSEVRVVTNQPEKLLQITNSLKTKFIIVGGEVLRDYYLLSRAKTVIIPQSTYSLFAILSNKEVETVYLRSDSLKMLNKNLITFKFWEY